MCARRSTSYHAEALLYPVSFTVYDMFALLVNSMAEYKFTESLNSKENMKLNSVEIYFLRGN